MNKKLTLMLQAAMAVTLLTTPHVARCQTKVEIGPRFGLGARMLTGNGVGDIGPGFKMGVVSKIPIKDKLFIMPGLAIARKGYYFNDFDIIFGEPTVENQRLTYLDLDVPLALKLSNTFYFQLGLQAGVLLNAYYTEDGDLTSGFGTGMYEALNKFDFGAITGFSCQLKNGFGFDLMADIGLQNIYKKTTNSDPNIYYSDAFLNGKNLLITFGFYYLFGHTPSAKTKTQ